MKKIKLWAPILIGLLAASSHAEDMNLDVKVGVEAYVIGNLDMSRYLLENALDEFNKDNLKSEFTRSRVLTKSNEQAAIEHLFPIYFELRDFEALKLHVSRHGTARSSSDIANYRNVRRGDLWTCRTLDFDERFIEASECWDKAGYEFERNISTRAATVKRVFKDRAKIFEERTY